MSTPKCSFNDGQIEGKALTRAEGKKKQTEDNISFYSEGCIDVCSHGLQSKKNTALKMMCCVIGIIFLLAQQNLPLPTGTNLTWNYFVIGSN